MTLASAIIRRGFRRSNLIAKSATPTTAEQAEGLEFLNGLILSTIGNEAGEELTDLNIGGSYDQSSYCSPFVPENVRLAVNQSAARELRLHPQPYDGQRVAWVDASGNFATYNLTINPNGRKIAGSASSLVLSANNDGRQYMYRADICDWVRLTELTASDELPFPTEFEDYFVTGLAMLLDPGYGGTLSEEGRAAYQRSEGQIRARYRRPRPKQDSGALGLMGQHGAGYGSVADFNAGRAW